MSYDGGKGKGATSDEDKEVIWTRSHTAFYTSSRMVAYTLSEIEENSKQSVTLFLTFFCSLPHLFCVWVCIYDVSMERDVQRHPLRRDMGPSVSHFLIPLSVFLDHFSNYGYFNPCLKI